MFKFIRRFKWYGIVAVSLLAACLYFFVSAFCSSPTDRDFLIQVSYTVATILIAWIAVFGFQIADELRSPDLELRYSHSVAERYERRDHQSWYLSLIVENQGLTAAKDAIVKCVSIMPSPIESIRSSSNRLISPIPLKWAYWDAYKKLYGDEGPKRSLHRTIYHRDACCIVSLTRFTLPRESVRALFELAIFPNRRDWRLEAGKEYTVTCCVEAENYRSDKTWTFKVKWNGSFPHDLDDLKNVVELKSC